MKFPVIKMLVIENLSLFRRKVDRTIKPGLNMIIGGNGIGKTTIINCIIFALVGNAHYDNGKGKNETIINTEYFKGRLEPKDYERAKVTLSFIVDGTEVKIVRSLYRPKILRIEVRDSYSELINLLEGDAEELEKHYQQMMEQLLEIGNFEHFVYIVANLLVFSEDRKTLIWDNETQNRIIRLLFSERTFDEEFNELSEQYTHYDTLGRHKSEERKDIRRSIQRWLKQQATSTEVKANAKNNLTEQEIEVQLADFESKRESLLDEYADLETAISSEITNIKSLLAEGDRIELEKTPLEIQLEKLENQFYSGIYQKVPSEYVIILETLIKRGTCPICGTSDTHLKELGINLRKNGQCIVCRNPIEYSDQNTENHIDESLSDAINKLRDRLDQLNSAQKACTEAQSNTNIEIKRLQDFIIQKQYMVKALEVEIAELRNCLISIKGNKPSDVSSTDKWLELQEQQIKQLDTEIDKYYQKRDEAKDALESLSAELEDLLNDVNTELSPLFSHFASKFLGTECELVVSQKAIGKKPVSFMYPRFYNKDRNIISQVSESQRFFLDQAFRMALITWLTQRRDITCFFIVETPEGSLDLAYERNVADMYIEFSSYGHSIIITSNLNSSNFLKGLYDAFPDEVDKNSRTLDLLQYGHLSTVQQKEVHINAFNERLIQLGLPFLRQDNESIRE